jgi:hypothetical protein
VSEGAEFLVALEANTKGAEAMVLALDTLTAKLSKADRATDKTEKKIGLLDRVFEKAGERTKDFAKETLSHFTALASFEGLKRIGEGLFELGKEAFEAAGEAERTRKSFEFLMGVEPADELLGFMDRLAKHTEFTDGALKGFAGSLVRAGFAGEDLERALGATIDLAALAPDKMAGAAEALQLLSKVKLKGGVSERELIGAGLSPEKLFKRLAGDLGIGVKAVEERLQQGKVDTGVLIEALYSEIAKKTGKPLGGAGVAQSFTFLARLEKAKDIIPNLFEELEKSEGLKGVTSGLGRLVEALDPDSPAGKKIVGGLEQMLDRFGKFTNEIDFNKVADQTLRALDVLEAGAKAAVTTVDLLITSLNGLRVAWNLLNGSREGVEKGSVLDKVFETVDAGKTGNKTLDDLATGLGGGGLATDIGAGIGRRIAQGLGFGVKAGAPEAARASSDLGATAEDALMSHLEIQSPSRVFARLGQHTARGFAIGIRGGTDEVQAEIDHTFSPDSLAGTSSSSVPGGGTRNEITINVSVGAGVDQAGAHEIGNIIATTTRAEIQRLLEQMQNEGGAA